MAAENIKEVKEVFHEKVGARRWVLAEVTFPAEYKKEGCEISEAQLKKLGFPNASLDAGWIVTSGKAAKNAEQPPMQLNITNPGVTAGNQKVVIQCYEGITKALNKELEEAGTKAGSAIATVLLIGR